MGLMVHRVESRLYTPDQNLDFVKDIEVDLKVARNALKARGNPSKRHAFYLFVSNYGGAMSVPMDPPYCLIYPMSYMRDMELDHFNTCNNPAGTCLRHCICCATLHYINDDPNQHREYSGRQLILPHGAQYKERLFPEILEPWKHQGPLTDFANKEPLPMELVGDFRSTDPIFKGCYGDSLLYIDVELGRLRQHGIHLPLYRSEIPVPPAPSYLQARQPKVTKWSPPRAATPNPSVAKVGPTAAQDAAPTHQLRSALTLLQPRSLPVPRSQPRTNRRSLPGLMALTSMAVPPPHPLSQLDANRKRFAQKTPTHSTPPFPSAPAHLMASAVQWDPTAM